MNKVSAFKVLASTLFTICVLCIVAYVVCVLTGWGQEANGLLAIGGGAGGALAQALRPREQTPKDAE